jgi:hypothetical protein
LGLGELQRSQDAGDNFPIDISARIAAEYFLGDHLQAINNDDAPDISAPWTARQYQEYYDSHYQLANDEQMAIVDEISNAANYRYSERQDCIERNRKGRYDINNIIRRFFITGDGGTGKTFTYNVLLQNFKTIIVIFLASHSKTKSFWHQCGSLCNHWHSSSVAS